MCVLLPSFPASMSGPYSLSPRLAESEEVECAMFTEDDDGYQALMLAEFGPLVPLPSHDELQAMMHDDEEIQSQAVDLLPEEDERQVMIGDENEMQARQPIPPCPADKRSRKKRKNPPPPQPSTEDDKKSRKKRKNPPPSQPSTEDDKKCRKKRKNPPPLQPSREEDDLESKLAEEIEERQATNKMMATCLLKRRHSAPEPSGPEGQTILRCQCKELPRDSRFCTLHQRAQYRSWMREQGDGEIPTAGSGDGVVVPTTRTTSKQTVLTYIRWRSRVWMPTRFYVEQQEKE